MKACPPCLGRQCICLKWAQRAEGGCISHKHKHKHVTRTHTHTQGQTGEVKWRSAKPGDTPVPIQPAGHWHPARHWAAGSFALHLPPAAIPNVSHAVWPEGPRRPPNGSTLLSKASPSVLGGCLGPCGPTWGRLCPVLPRLLSSSNADSRRIWSPWHARHKGTV